MDYLRLGKLTQTVFTKFATPKTDLERKWYGIIEVKEKSYIVEYTTRFRSEAVRFFEGQAKSKGGKLGVVKAY